MYVMGLENIIGLSRMNLFIKIEHPYFLQNQKSSQWRDGGMGIKTVFRLLSAIKNLIYKKASR